MISRKTLLAITALGSLCLFVAAYPEIFSLCSDDNYSTCNAMFDSVAETLLPFLALALFFGFVYWAPDYIYRAWFRFVLWWIPLSMLAILIAPKYSGNILDPIEKGTVALFFSGVFVVVSILIIAIKYFRTRS
jgi:hypothetical protein